MHCGPKIKKSCIHSGQEFLLPIQYGFSCVHFYKWLIGACVIQATLGCEKLVLDQVPSLTNLARAAITAALDRRCEHAIDNHLLPQATCIDRYKQLEACVVHQLSNRLPGCEYWQESFPVDESDDPMYVFLTHVINTSIEDICALDARMQDQFLSLVHHLGKTCSFTQLRDFWCFLESEHTHVSNYIKQRLEFCFGFECDESSAETISSLIKNVSLSEAGYVLMSAYPGKRYSLYMRLFAKKTDYLVRDDLRCAPRLLCAVDDSRFMYADYKTVYGIDGACLSRKQKHVLQAAISCSSNMQKELIAIGLASGEVVLFNAVSFQQVDHLYPSCESVVALTYRSSNLVLADKRGTIQWYCYPGKRLDLTISGPPGPVRFLDLVHDDALLVVCQLDDVRLFNKKNASSQAVHLELPPAAAVVHADMRGGIFCYSNSGDDYLRFFDPVGDRCLFRIRCYSMSPLFSIKGYECIIARSNGALRLRKKQWRVVLAHMLRRRISTTEECDMLAHGIMSSIDDKRDCEDLLQKIAQRRAALQDGSFACSKKLSDV